MSSSHSKSKSHFTLSPPPFFFNKDGKYHKRAPEVTEEESCEAGEFLTLMWAGESPAAFFSLRCVIVCSFCTVVQEHSEFPPLTQTSGIGPPVLCFSAQSRAAAHTASYHFSNTLAQQIWLPRSGRRYLIYNDVQTSRQNPMTKLFVSLKDHKSTFILVYNKVLKLEAACFHWR